MNNSVVKVLLIEDDNDLQDAFTIREIVFVKEQKVSHEEEFDEFDIISRHFIAKVKGVSVGTARWRETNKGIKLERFTVLKEYRGMGVGSALVSAVLKDIDHLIENSKGKCYLHAQVEAIPLYAKFGFQSQGDIFMECDIPHQNMIL
ncbi:MAG: GNAT family N-acetyltransferase [Cyclobacteriaceae bacterium]|nr:GNAT family N-acetyltransferase [Cyclobacteriaceae bacterium]